MTKGFQVTVVVLAAALFTARPAAAHISPVACNGNGVQVSIGVDAVGGRIVNGQTVTYNFSIGNLNAPLITACDASGVLVRFYCPGPDGLPDLTNPIDVTTVSTLPAGVTPFALPSKTCTVNVNPGVTQAIAEVIAGKQTGAIGFACSSTSGNCNQGRLHQTSTDLSFRSDKVVGVTVDTCAARIDKQISCDGGRTYVNVGTNNTADFCTGWNATATMPAESIFVRYVVTNQGSAGLFSCSLTESNGGIVGANGTTFTNIPGRSCVGGDLAGQGCTTDADCPGSPAGTCPPQTLTTDFNNQTCTASLAAAEPDTASVSCFCTANHIQNLTATAQDTARFDCRTPGLTVTKDCATHNATGNPVTIRVTNSGTADLANCAITDTVFAGAPCPATTGPSSNVSISPSTITSLPQGAAAVTATGTATGLTQDACNTVSVTCDIVGSVDRTNPSQRKKITATASDTCEVPPVCGDNRINQSSETCDGTDLDSTACTSCRASGGPDACTCCGDRVFQPSDGTCDGTQVKPGLPAIPGGETCRLPGNGAPCTYCGDGTVQSTAGETCDPPGSACTVNGGPGVCGAAGGPQACTCVPCSVQVDKQVKCGAGPAIDVGFVTNNEDGTRSCVGWNAFTLNGAPMAAEALSVSYTVKNTGGTGLFGCTVAESNTAISSSAVSIGNVAQGGTSSPVPINKTCSDSLDAQEPDTATVSCFCTADLNPNLKVTAQDSASFDCQTPGLVVTKDCGLRDANGNNAVTITVRNTGSADFLNCTVSDTNFTDASCPASGSPSGTSAAVPVNPSSIASLAHGAMTTATGTVNGLTKNSCNTTSVTCEIAGSVDPANPTARKRITATAQDTCETCSVQVDKQVKCGAGPAVDVGFVTNNEDGTASCLGWNAFTLDNASMAAEALSVSYTVKNTGGTGLFSCTVAESNTVISSSAVNIGNVVQGATSNSVPINTTCSDQLDAQEPDTATVSCFCTADLNPNFKATAKDSASFNCQTPGLTVTKDCGLRDVNGNSAVTITVKNTGSADLANCTVSDTNFTDASCPANGTPSGTSTPVTVSPSSIASLTAGNMTTATATVAGLTKNSCNTTAVTCEIVGSVDPAHPTARKTITARAQDTCETCSAQVDKQVKCGAGPAVDVGFVTNNEDGTASCLGWNAFTLDGAPMAAEALSVSYTVKNTGGTGLFSCTVAESNTAISSSAVNIGNVVQGATSNSVPINATCSDSLDAQEPDTATLSCFCTADLNPNFKATAKDSASFDCQTPGLTVAKDCALRDANGNSAVTITVKNTGSADLVNCTVSDTNFTDASCPATGSPSGTSAAVAVSPSSIASLAHGAMTIATATVTGLTQNSCNTTTVTCEIVGSADPANPSVRKTITARAQDTCETCSVQVDKQVMCGPGQPFVDSGFVTANEDGTLSCAGINGQPIDVRYAVRNTGGVPVFGCTLTDSNGNVLSTPASVGNLNVGVTSPTIDVNTKVCSNTVAASEPDTATVSCFCTSDLNPNLKASAFDSANIQCAGLTVDKTCRQNTTDNTDSFDVKLTNNGSVDLQNCVVSDTFFPGDTSCTNGATTAPGFPKTVASLAHGAMSTVSGNMGVLSDDSCNKASVTCDIVGSTNKITGTGTAACPRGSCSLCVSKTACIEAPPPAGEMCTGGAIALTVSYTGQDINGPATVVITGSNTAATTTYNLPSLHAGDVLTKASENGFSIDATAHAQSKLGSRTTITINGVVEVLHTSCSCTATPETNLVVCNPLCLDSSSPDNSTGSKGPPSPLWTLVSLKDPSLGIETCDGGTMGPCQTALQPVTSSCVGHVKELVLEYNGGGCAAMSNQQQADKVKCTQSGSTPNASPVRLRITDGGGGTVWVDTGAANVAIGDDVTVSASNAGKATLAGDTAVNVFNSSNTLIERVQFKTDCSQPLAAGNVFGGFKVVSFTTDKGGSSAAGTTVNYTYKIVNTGTGPATNVKVIDDKLGTIPGSPISSIPAGGMVTLTAQKVVNETTINTVTASCNNDFFSTQATAAVVGPCVLGYPYTSSNSKTATVFNESEVLRAFRPLGSAGINDRIQAFYSDEHAMLLGVKTSTANVSPFTPAPGKLSSFVLSPQVGDLIATDPFGRPFFPALFLTDITADPALICTAADPQNATRCHDWQWGGTAIPPTAVFGTWKAATKVGTTILTGTDPAKNNFDLDGSGNCTTSPPSATCPDVVPTGLTNQGYGTEARWDVNGLGLTTGHIYRAQFMVHDGDQNKTGGDVGQGCLTVFIVPETPCP